MRLLYSLFFLLIAASALVPANRIAAASDITAAHAACRDAAAYPIGKNGVEWVNLNPLPAINVCRKALHSEPDEPRLKAYLARALLKFGGPERRREAIRLAKEAASTGVPQGLTRLASMSPPEQALELDRRAAAMQYGPAQYRVALVTLQRAADAWRRTRSDGKSPEVRSLHNRAVELLKASGKNGFAWAFYQMARLHLNEDYGGVVKRDDERANFYLQKAADLGHDPAQLLLGERLLRGRGAKKDVARGKALIMGVAKRGKPSGQIDVASMYAKGRFGDAERVRGRMRWLQAAAAGGHPLGQAALGNVLSFSSKVTQDIPRGVTLLNKAAEGGNPQGMLGMAILTAEGLGVTQSTPKAADWVERYLIHSGQPISAVTFDAVKGDIFEDVPQLGSNKDAGEEDDYEYRGTRLSKVALRAVLPELAKRGVRGTAPQAAVLLYMAARDRGDTGGAAWIPQAYRLLRDAADRGEAGARYALGRLLLAHGEDVERLVPAQQRKRTRETIAGLYLAARKAAPRGANWRGNIDDSAYQLLEYATAAERRQLRAILRSDDEILNRIASTHVSATKRDVSLYGVLAGGSIYLDDNLFKEEPRRAEAFFSAFGRLWRRLGRERQEDWIAIAEGGNPYLALVLGAIASEGVMSSEHGNPLKWYGLARKNGPSVPKPNLEKWIAEARAKMPIAQERQQPVPKLARPSDPNQAYTCHLQDAALPKLTDAGPKVKLTASGGAQGMRSGQSITVSWTVSGAAHPACRTAFYLVLAMPKRVRLAGEGFTALAPAARAPFGIAHAGDDLRAFVPLHMGKTARSGQLKLNVYSLGKFKITSALVEVPRSSKGMVPARTIVREAHPPLNLDVMPGVPKVVIQDPFSLDAPQSVTFSNSGEFAMHVHKGFYRIYDRRTGALVIEREGTRAKFSPTSRFVSATLQSTAHVEIVDLYAETTALRIDPGNAASRGDFVTSIGWFANDSYAVIGYEGWGAIGFAQMLVARPYRYQHTSCGGCGSWGDAVIEFDPENMIAAIHGPQSSHNTYSLAFSIDYSDWSRHPIPGDAHVLVDGPFVIREEEPRWVASKPLKLSYGPHDFKQPFLVEHKPQSSDAPVRVASAGTLRGRAYSGLRAAVALKGARMTNRTQRVLTRLEAVGLHFTETDKMFFDSPTPFQKDGDIGQHFVSTKRIGARLFKNAKPRAAFSDAIAKIMEEGCSAAAIRRGPVLRVWSWRQEREAFALAQLHCATSTGYIPEGALFLYRYGGGKVEGQDLANLTPVVVFEDLQVFRFARNKLILVSEDDTISIFDVSTRKTDLTIKNVEGTDLIEKIGTTRDKRHIIQINSDGRFFVYNIKDGATTISGLYVDDEIALYDRQRRFDATQEGGRFIHLKFPGDPHLHKLDQFRSILHSPELASSALSRVTPAKVANIPVPPSLAVSLPKAEQHQPAPRLRMRAVSAVGLARIDVFRDGQLLRSLAATGSVADQTIDVPRNPETRWLTVRAVDSKGLTSVPQLVALPVQRKSADTRPAGRLFAIAVGTDIYTDPRIGALSFAKADARAFAATVNTLRSPYYRTKEAVAIYDAADVKTQLLHRIGDYAQRLTADDTLVIHIASHGLRDGEGKFYLATRNTNPDDLEGTAISWEELGAALATVPARVVVLLDACHSGAATGTATNDGAVEALLRNRDRSFVVIAASKGRQFSFEGARLSGGVFTASITNVLKNGRRRADLNGNGLIELSELYGAIKQRVVQLTDGSQTPWIARNRMVGEVPLF